MVPFISWLVASGTRAFLVLFFLGLALRVATLALIPSDLIPPNPQWETGAVALSLVERGEFADPYLIPTGPTAHMPPIQVGLFAGLYKVFGYTYAGGLIRWLLVSAAHAAVFALLPWFGPRVGLAREAGLLGGLAGALVPHWPYELESFSAVAMVLLLVGFLNRWARMEKAGPLAEQKRAEALRPFLFGLAAGVSFHLQPVLLPVVLGCLGFELWWRTAPGRWGRIGIVLLGMVVACVPWGWRNYQQLDAICFVRCNLGLELYVGNHEGAHADIDVSDARGSFRHPRTDLVEAEEVLALGEAEYMRRKREEALGWIAANPGEFARLTANRFALFWGGRLHRFPSGAGSLLLLLLAGYGAWRVFPNLRPPQRAALLIPLLTYPLIYYVVVYMPRYGYPVRWILFLLAGSALWGWLGGREPSPTLPPAA